MKAPSNRVLEQNSEGLRLLTRIKDIPKPVVAIDTIDALTASLLVDHSSFFEASWISSLGISSRLGFPDAYNLSPRDYTEAIIDIKMVSQKTFIVVDADNGGQSYKNTSYAFKLYSSIGASLAFVENKRGVKYNSVDPDAGKFHTLENKDIFAQKIRTAIDSQNKTLVGIRLEDSIVNDEDEIGSLNDALNSVDYFIKKSKPDFFLFHWKKESPEIPLKFAKEYHKYMVNNHIVAPPYLACVPSTYSKNVSSQKLFKAGYNVIIYGNVLLRVQVQAVVNAFKNIESNNSLQKLENEMMPTKLILDLMEGNRKYE